MTKAFSATAAPLAGDPDLAAAQGSIPSALHAVDLLAKVTAGGDDGEPGGTTTTTQARKRGQAAGTPGGLDKGAAKGTGAKGDSPPCSTPRPASSTCRSGRRSSSSA